MDKKRLFLSLLIIISSMSPVTKVVAAAVTQFCAMPYYYNASGCCAVEEHTYAEHQNCFTTQAECQASTHCNVPTPAPAPAPAPTPAPAPAPAVPTPDPSARMDSTKIIKGWQ